MPLQPHQTCSPKQRSGIWNLHASLPSWGWEAHRYSYYQGKMAFTETLATRDWKRRCCKVSSMQWKDIRANVSMLRKETVAFFPLKFSYSMREIVQLVVSYSERHCSMHSFHPIKGTPNWKSFVEKPSLAGEFLLFHSRKKQPRATSSNQGKMAIAQTPKPRV